MVRDLVQCAKISTCISSPLLYFSVNQTRLIYFITSLGKRGGYVFGSVGLSVCLFVDHITQTVMDGLE